MDRPRLDCKEQIQPANRSAAQRKVYISVDGRRKYDTAALALRLSCFSTLLSGSNHRKISGIQREIQQIRTQQHCQNADIAVLYREISDVQRSLLSLYSAINSIVTTIQDHSTRLSWCEGHIEALLRKIKYIMLLIKSIVGLLSWVASGPIVALVGDALPSLSSSLRKSMHYFIFAIRKLKQYVANPVGISLKLTSTSSWLSDSSPADIGPAAGLKGVCTSRLVALVTVMLRVFIAYRLYTWMMRFGLRIVGG